ncbi:MAG: hypothetical protein NUV73_01105 [Candidatus Daviesbacteria bacterium]|nr:hypothetical protein [Candidatus Daviesbacteria bacterium]
MQIESGSSKPTILVTWLDWNHSPLNLDRIPTKEENKQLIQEINKSWKDHFTTVGSGSQPTKPIPKVT